MKTKVIRALIIFLLAVCLVLPYGCSKDGGGVEKNELINYCEGGNEFDLTIWQGLDSVYKIEDAEVGKKITYTKMSSSHANLALLAEVSDVSTDFKYINITLSGTQDKDVMLTLGEGIETSAFVGSTKIFMDAEPKTYSLKLKNRLALVALTDVYLSAQSGSSGLGVSGIINLQRIWFSKTRATNAEQEEVDDGKTYSFVTHKDWAKSGGYYTDTSWTNLRIAPAPNKTTRVYTESRAVASYAPIIKPLNIDKFSSTLTLTFDNVGNSVNDIQILLRGGQKTYRPDWQGWEYWDVRPLNWTNTVESADTNEASIEYDLASAISELGTNVGDDGYMLVIFIESHDYHPAKDARDGFFNIIFKGLEVE